MYIFDLLAFSQRYWHWWKQICTRYTGSQSDKCNRIDAVFEVYEATKMAGDISDDGGVTANEGDRNDKCGVTVHKPCKNGSVWKLNQTEYCVLSFLRIHWLLCDYEMMEFI